LWLDGSEYYELIDMSSGTNTSRISSIANGLHNWSVWCYDLAGNLNNSDPSDIRFFTVLIQLLQEIRRRKQ